MDSVITGSSDTLVSSMHFMKDGELLIETSKDAELSDEEFATLKFTQDFMLYALDREDWITEFLVSMVSHVPPKKPDLFLIKGGLEDS